MPPGEAVLIATIPWLLLPRHLPGVGEAAWAALGAELPHGPWALQTLRAWGWTSCTLSLPGSPCPAGKDLWFADSAVGTGLGQALRGDGALGTPSALEQLAPHPWRPPLVVSAAVSTWSPWFPAVSQGNRSCKLQSLQPPLPFPRLCSPFGRVPPEVGSCGDRLGYCMASAVQGGARAAWEEGLWSLMLCRELGQMREGAAGWDATGMEKNLGRAETCVSWRGEGGVWEVTLHSGFVLE